MADIVHAESVGANVPPEYTLIERPNSRVWWTNGLIATLTVSTTLSVGFAAGAVTTGNPLIAVPTGILGALAGTIAVLALKPKAFISNDVATWFLTTDRLRSLLGFKDIFVLYGPGEHPSYIWEKREASNSIIAEESPQGFDFTVTCPDGVLKGKGSFRLRPNPNNPIRFLTSVAAASQDLVDLVIVQAVEFLGNTSVLSATRKLGGLNQSLKTAFQTGKTAEVTEFEKRFSLEVGDVTVSELLPSEETQRTISALTEAAVIKKGTALLLGMSMRTVKKMLEEGTMSKEAYERARRDFMSISGNFDGMNVDRKEFAIEGLEGLKHVTPEVATAITALARQLPNVLPAAGAAGKSKAKGGPK